MSIFDELNDWKPQYMRKELVLELPKLPPDNKVLFDKDQARAVLYKLQERRDKLEEQKKDLFIYCPSSSSGTTSPAICLNNRIDQLLSNINQKYPSPTVNISPASPPTNDHHHQKTTTKKEIIAFHPTSYSIRLLHLLEAHTRLTKAGELIAEVEGAVK